MIRCGRRVCPIRYDLPRTHGVRADDRLDTKALGHAEDSCVCERVSYPL